MFSPATRTRRQGTALYLASLAALAVLIAAGITAAVLAWANVAQAAEPTTPACASVLCTGGGSGSIGVIGADR